VQFHKHALDDGETEIAAWMASTMAEEKQHEARVNELCALISAPNTTSIHFVDDDLREYLRLCHDHIFSARSIDDARNYVRAKIISKAGKGNDRQLLQHMLIGALCIYFSYCIGTGN
jgi:hypothetical protein